ncbi:hypothetical protein PINS_up004352 [Pythium insidiosum]|nr:hypothetical protein PINS_up004352 [Pythium insidiosum]
MSGVELPLVPSARASSSSSSSSSASSRALLASSRSRSALHSASSTASYRSERTRQSLYDEDDDEAHYNGNEDDEEDEENETNSDDGDELPQAHGSSQSSSSSGLWDQVEVFLNKPPPDFAQLTKDADAKLSAVSKTLPTLPRGSERKPTAPSSSSGGNNNSNHSHRVQRPSRLAPQGSSKALSKPIDPHLLQQAFAYAERIQQLSFDDDEADQDQQQQQLEEHRARVPVGRLRPDATGPRMPSELVKEPSGSTLRGGKAESSSTDRAAPKKKSKKSALVTERSAYGAAVKPSKRKSNDPRARDRDRDREPAATNGWDSSMEPSEPRKPSSASGSGLDQQTIQSLVSSLQNGTTVDELRRELAASQQSLAYSRQVIQDAAKSFFTHKR